MCLQYAYAGAIGIVPTWVEKLLDNFSAGSKRAASRCQKGVVTRFAPAGEISRYHSGRLAVR